MRTRRRSLSFARMRRPEWHSLASTAIALMEVPDKQAWLGAAAVALAYSLPAAAGSSFAYPPTVLAAFCLPNAMLMGALILARRKLWWFYLVALLATGWLARISFVIGPPKWVAVYCLVNGCAVFIGAFALVKVGVAQSRLESFASALRLVMAGGVAVPLFSLALMGLALSVFEPAPHPWTAGLSYALSNGFAVLMIVPLMLRVALPPSPASKWAAPPRPMEASAISILLTALGAIILFSPAGAASYGSVLPWMALPIVLWAAIRFRITGLCSTMLATGVIGLLVAFWQLGPFASRATGDSTFAVLVGFFAIGIPMLLLAAAVEERADLEHAQISGDARFRTTFERNIVPTVIWYEDRITDANDAFFKLTGYGPADVASLRFDRLTRDGVSSEELANSPVTEQELVLRDGRGISALFSVCPFPLERRAGIAYVFDLSESRHAEAARKEVEELHSAVLASIHDQIVVLDHRGNIIDANNTWQLLAHGVHITPFSRMQVGDHFLKHCIDWDSQGDYNATLLAEGVADVLSGKQVRATLDYAMPASGVVAWFHVAIEPLRRADGGAVMIWTDITKRKQADAQARAQHEQLAHLGRVAVLGELSGAFAHELTQPLTSILGNGEAAMHVLERTGFDPEEMRSMLRDIVADSIRAAEVIKRLRALLTRGEISRQPLDLNDVVRDVLELARSDLIARQVSVSTDLDRNLPFVLGDRVQLQQVVLNLVINACEAMAQTDLSKRRISIITRFDPNSCTISCALLDHGRGIAGADCDRIFQPFVTTKPGGLGMGLAICRSIIEAHGGRLWAENAPDGGALFSFTANMG
jgi:signal transduction histidine kinase/integral membrane sensor domain MASE1